MMNFDINRHGVPRHVVPVLSSNLLCLLTWEVKLQLSPLSDDAQVAVGTVPWPAARQAEGKQVEPLYALRHFQLELIQLLRIWKEETVI